MAKLRPDSTDIKHSDLLHPWHESCSITFHPCSHLPSAAACPCYGPRILSGQSVLWKNNFHWHDIVYTRYNLDDKQDICSKLAEYSLTISLMIVIG